MGLEVYMQMQLYLSNETSSYNSSFSISIWALTVLQNHIKAKHQ